MLRRLLREPWAFLAAASAATCVCVWASRFAAFNGFQPYDDEGYILLSLREYARGGVLYDEVYSQYGPAYFELVTSTFAVLTSTGCSTSAGGRASPTSR